MKLPSTAHYLPSKEELSGTSRPQTIVPTKDGVIIGIPEQEEGVRPARALPYELNVFGRMDPFGRELELQFVNTGKAGAVFQVRSGNTTDPVRNYTVEAGKELSGHWNLSGPYDLSVYGPNGFMRFFKGSTGSGSAALDVRPQYIPGGLGSIFLIITNVGSHKATVTVLDAYSGEKNTRVLGPRGGTETKLLFDRFHGWYDLVITVAEDPTFENRLAGHIETGSDSISDPAMGGLLTLKAVG